MAGYINAKNMNDVDVAFYYESEKRAIEKAQKKLERLKERAKRYKGMDIANLEEDVNKEVDALPDEVIMGYSVDEYIERRHHFSWLSDYWYDVTRKKNPEELEEAYYKEIKSYRDDCKRCNLAVAREQYFLFNKMTPEQEEEYYKYYYECALRNELEEARRYAIYRVMREKKKKTHIMDYERLNDSAYSAIDKDIKEIENMATVGIIERVEMLDERQKRRKKQIKESINNNDDLLSLGGSGLCGLIALGMEALAPAATLDTAPGKVYVLIGILARYAVLQAALHVLLYKRGYNRSEPQLIEEAKTLGVYDAFLKSREAFREYSEYCEKLLEEYDINSDLSRDRRAYNGF